MPMFGSVCRRTFIGYSFQKENWREQIYKSLQASSLSSSTTQRHYMCSCHHWLLSAVHYGIVICKRVVLAPNISSEVLSLQTLCFWGPGRDWPRIGLQQAVSNLLEQSHLEPGVEWSRQTRNDLDYSTAFGSDVATSCCSLSMDSCRLALLLLTSLAKHHRFGKGVRLDWSRLWSILSRCAQCLKVGARLCGFQLMECSAMKCNGASCYGSF